MPIRILVKLRDKNLGICLYGNYPWPQGLWQNATCAGSVDSWLPVTPHPAAAVQTPAGAAQNHQQQLSTALGLALRTGTKPIRLLSRTGRQSRFRIPGKPVQNPTISHPLCNPACLLFAARACSSSYCRVPH